MKILAVVLFVLSYSFVAWSCTREDGSEIPNGFTGDRDVAFDAANGTLTCLRNGQSFETVLRTAGIVRCFRAPINGFINLAAGTEKQIDSITRLAADRFAITTKDEPAVRIVCTVERPAPRAAINEDSGTPTRATPPAPAATPATVIQQ